MSNAATLRAKRFDFLYQDVKGFTVNFQRGVNVDDIGKIVRYAMSVVQSAIEFKDLSGLERKDFVVAVVIDVVNDLLADPEITGKLKPEELEAIKFAVSTVPMIIDTAVGFAKTYLNTASTSGSSDDGVERKGCCY